MLTRYPTYRRKSKQDQGECGAVVDIGAQRHIDAMSNMISSEAGNPHGYDPLPSTSQPSAVIANERAR